MASAYYWHHCACVEGLCLVLVLFRHALFCVLSSFALISHGKSERANCFTLIVFLLSRGCWCSVSHSHGGVGWSAVRDWDTVKPVLKGHSKIDITKVLKTNGSLIKVESIAECSLEHSAILSTCIKRQSILKINVRSSF